MYIISECYLSTFKEHGWSESKVKEYIQYRLGIDINEIVKEEGAWQDAWLKYYTTKYCEDLNDCNVNMDGECVNEEYSEEAQIADHPGCICKDNQCIIAPTDPNNPLG